MRSLAFKYLHKSYSSFPVIHTPWAPPKAGESSTWENSGRSKRQILQQNITFVSKTTSNLQLAYLWLVSDLISAMSNSNYTGYTVFKHQHCPYICSVLSTVFHHQSVMSGLTAEKIQKSDCSDASAYCKSRGRSMFKTSWERARQ